MVWGKFVKGWMKVDNVVVVSVYCYVLCYEINNVDNLGFMVFFFVIIR